MNETRKKLELVGSTLFDELSDKLIFNLASKFYGGTPSSNNESGLKFFPSNYRPPPGYWEAFS